MIDGVVSAFEATDTTFLEPGDIIEVRTTEADLRPTAVLSPAGSRPDVPTSGEARRHELDAP